MGLTLLISIVAVGLFVLAMSLTLIFKGHHIDSEIGENKHMQERGIKCAAQQMRQEERDLRGECGAAPTEECYEGGCASCTTHCADGPKKS